jgi:hypothetical protein
MLVSPLYIHYLTWFTRASLFFLSGTSSFHLDPAIPIHPQRCRRRYKVGDCAPSATPALARLAVQGAVSVVSTWGGGEGRRRQGGRGRRAGTQAQVRPRSHPPAPTSSPLDIPRRQLLRSTRTRACTRARVTRWAPPRPMNHLLTTYVPHQHTHLPLLNATYIITLHQCPFKSALGRVRLPKCRHDKKRPISSGSRSNTSITDLTPQVPPPHSPVQHQHPPTPPAPCPSTTHGIHTASARVRAPGGSTNPPPPPPPGRV